MTTCGGHGRGYGCERAGCRPKISRGGTLSEFVSNANRGDDPGINLVVQKRLELNAESAGEDDLSVRLARRVLAQRRLSTTKEMLRLGGVGQSQPG